MGRQDQSALLGRNDSKYRSRGGAGQTLHTGSHRQLEPLDHRLGQQNPALVRTPRVPLLNLELSAGLGVARIAYHTEPVNGPKPSTNLNRVRYLPMPTELGISLVYLFNAKK